MSVLHRAMERGMAAGLVTGLWESMGSLPAEAQEVLSNPNRSDLTNREKGLREGLAQTGHLRWRWWSFSYVPGTPTDGGQPLRSMINLAIEETLEKNPDRQLTPEGFRLAWVRELRKLWPEVTPADAAMWLNGYAGAPLGSPGFDWSYGAARDLAREYVAEFGEAA